MAAVLEEITVGIEAFIEKVEESPNLTPYDTECTDDGDAIIIRNTDIEEGIEGAFVRVSVDEVCAIDNRQIISCINNSRGPIMLNGITRIVGYYSRVNNWNKSKIGELRDRDQKHYTVGGHNAKHDSERHKAIDGLG